MAKADFLNTDDDQFAGQLQTFKTNLGSYAATLGVSPAQVPTAGR